MRSFFLAVRSWSALRLLAFLLMLVAVAWLPLAFQTRGRLMRAKEELKAATETFPTVNIARGNVTVEPPGRYAIKESRTGQELFVIDLTKTPADVAALEADVAVLTKTHLVVHRKRRGDTRMVDLSQVQMIVDRDRVWGWLDLTEALAPLFVLLAGVLISLVYRLVQSFLYAAAGLLMKAPDYWTSWRLSLAAVTPVIVLDTLRSALDLTIPGWAPLCFALAMGLLWYGVNAAAEPAPAPSQPPQ